MFSIIIVTWNNHNLLKTTIDSIFKNSYYKHNIYVHVNEHINDNLINWFKRNNITYTHSEKNIGLPKGANQFKDFITDYVCLMDDDLYCLPNWDKAIIDFKDIWMKNYKFWLSSTMIEPKGNNPVTLSPYDFGTNLTSFDENRLLKMYTSLLGKIPPMVSLQATPVVIPIDLWKKIGGYPEEFDLGIGSEEGLAKKLYDIGVRDFIGVNTSLVYHFQRTTTKKISNYNEHAQNREIQFKKLFGITTAEFNNIIGVKKPWRT